MFNKVEIQPDQVWEMGCEFCPKKDAEIERLISLIESQGREHTLPCLLGPLCPWCEIAALQAELAKWEEQVNVRDAHVDALKVEIAALKSALDAEIGYSRRREDEIERLQKEIKAMQEVINLPYNQNQDRKARIKELEATHGWHCGCDHWNGPNLSVCAQCGRTPLEGRDDRCSTKLKFSQIRFGKWGVNFVPRRTPRSSG